MDIEKTWQDICAAIDRYTHTPWKFVTSGSGTLSIGTPVVRLSLALTGGALWVSNGGKPIALAYGGVGGSGSLSLVPFPAGFSFSIPAMPSSGTIYKLPFAGQSLCFNELRGCFLMAELGADAGAGRSTSLMFMGADPLVIGALPVQAKIPALIATSNACVRFGGMYASALPFNASLSCYLGVIY